MPPLPDRIGPYRVLKKLGEGGMGVVFAVEDKDSPRTLALKLIRGTGPDATSLERFRREAEMLARVQHRNVVRVHSVGQLAEGSYILEELIEGEPLDAFRARGCSPEQAVAIVHELTGALTALHAAQILHRDLKPSNVLMRAGQTPVLLDFGISRDQTAQTLTNTGALMGSPSYMAPEQAKGERATPVTDVYGLGVILYDLLTGQAPFEGNTFQILKKVMREDPVWPSALNAEIPEPLSAICRRAMAKAPEDRYESPQTLGEDLARYQRGEALDERTWQGTPSRGPLALGAALVLGALTLVGASVAVFFPEAPPVEAPVEVTQPKPEPSSAPQEDLLWRLRPGQDLRLSLDRNEESGVSKLRVEGDLALKVKGFDASGVAQIEARWLFLKIDYSTTFTATGESPTFDTRQPPTTPHPFDGLRVAIDQPLSLTLDPASGQVSDVEGLAPLREQADTYVVASTYSHPKRQILREAFYRGVFACFHVLGTEQLPWRARSNDAYSARRRDPGPRVLSTVIGSDTVDTYRIGARAQFRDGLLVEGEITQAPESENSGASTTTCTITLTSRAEAEER